MTFFETIGKIIERYSSFFAQGVVNTLIIAAFSVLLGTILGTLMATMRMGKILPLKWLAVAYIEFIRGTPLMVQLMFIFYGLPMIGVKIPDISWIPNFGTFIESFSGSIIDGFPEDFHFRHAFYKNNLGITSGYQQA